MVDDGKFERDSHGTKCANDVQESRPIFFNEPSVRKGTQERGTMQKLVDRLRLIKVGVEEKLQSVRLRREIFCEQPVAEESSVVSVNRGQYWGKANSPFIVVAHNQGFRDGGQQLKRGRSSSRWCILSLSCCCRRSGRGSWAPANTCWTPTRRVVASGSASQALACASLTRSRLGAPQLRSSALITRVSGMSLPAGLSIDVIDEGIDLTRIEVLV